MRYRLNAPQAIHQEIEGEVVAINLATGNYFSLRGTAAEIWELLEAGRSIDSVVDVLAQRYEAAPEVLRAEVTALGSMLEEEGLLVPTDDGGSSSVAHPESAAPGTRGREPFEPPMLEKFDDMQDLILLDPVHEVEEAEGWPHARAPRDG